LLFRPGNKTVVIGESDPRRLIYFPDVQPGVELHLPSVGHTHLDLFFIAPFYHQLLPHLDQVIVLDLDLEFRWALIIFGNVLCFFFALHSDPILLVRVGVTEVQKLFSLLKGDKLVGLVADQSPYYPFITSGSGPPRQGLNSGLMLFQLGKMRRSFEYNSELNAAKMEKMSDRFLPHADWSLGDQDWFSLLSWSKPHLVAILF